MKRKGVPQTNTLDTWILKRPRPESTAAVPGVAVSTAGPAALAPDLADRLVEETVTTTTTTTRKFLPATTAPAPAPPAPPAPAPPAPGAHPAVGAARPAHRCCGRLPARRRARALRKRAPKTAGPQPPARGRGGGRPPPGAAGERRRAHCTGRRRSGSLRGGARKTRPSFAQHGTAPHPPPFCERGVCVLRRVAARQWRVNRRRRG